MKRRQAIQSLGAVTTHVMFPSVLAGFLASCSNPSEQTYAPDFFTEQEWEVVPGLLDVILPATRTQSASQVHVHHFLDAVFARCFTPLQQSEMHSGLGRLIAQWRETDDKKSLVSEIDERAFAEEADFAYFKAIKQYAVIGFFTSHEGTTKASNYIKVPGDYQGEIPLDDDTLNYGRTTMRYYI